MHEYDRLTPLQLIKQRSEPGISEVNAVAVAEQDDAVQFQVVQGFTVAQTFAELWPQATRRLILISSTGTSFGDISTAKNSSGGALPGMSAAGALIAVATRPGRSTSRKPCV